MTGAIPSLRQADARYPWPPKKENTEPLSKELLAGTYPRWPTTLYDAVAGVALDTFTVYSAEPKLLEQAQKILATKGNVLGHDVVYYEKLVEVPLAHLIGLRPMGEEGYRNQEFNKALAAAPGAVAVGTLLRCRGGDGYGWYAVTRATKSTVDVEYRGFGVDEWRDRYIESLGRKRIPRSYVNTLVYRMSP